MNGLFIVLLGLLVFLLGFLVSKLLTTKASNIRIPRWTNRDLDSTIVAIGMLIIFGGFVEEANISDKDVFTRLVELFNGVWLLILGFLFGKMSNSDNGEKENDAPKSTDHQRSGDTV